MNPRWMVRVGFALLRRPGLWRVALRQLVRLRAPGWWHRRPYLPVPARAYWRFRLQTAYGDDRAPDVEDVVTYLRWCDALARVAPGLR